MKAPTGWLDLRTLGGTLLLVAASTAIAQSLNWKQMPDSANDIGVGPRGGAWMIGTDGTNEFGIHRFVPAGTSLPVSAYSLLPQKTPRDEWWKESGKAVRIDIGPHGPWVVNAAGGIFRWIGNSWLIVELGARESRPWDQMPGAAVDIGVGADGSVWVIGRTPEPGGYGIYRWTGSSWNKIPGSGVRIDVDPKGHAWVVTSGHAIYRYDGAKFVAVPGSAVDIGIGAEGSIFVAGTDGGIHKWNGSAWTKVRDGGFTHVSVDHAGRPWAIDANKKIWLGDR